MTERGTGSLAPYTVVDLFSAMVKNGARYCGAHHVIEEPALTKDHPTPLVGDLRSRNNREYTIEVELRVCHGNVAIDLYLRSGGITVWVVFVIREIPEKPLWEEVIRDCAAMSARISKARPSRAWNAMRARCSNSSTICLTTRASKLAARRCISKELMSAQWSVRLLTTIRKKLKTSEWNCTPRFLRSLVKS